MAENRMFVRWFYEEAPSRCRSGRKRRRTDLAEMRACQWFVAQNGKKKEKTRERESIVFWENSPATNRIIYTYITNEELDI